jgi:CBS domain-containing protein
MALALISQPATEVPVRVVARPTLHTCRLTDDLRDALRTMRTRKVRRLPVVDGAGLLQGMLSLNDVALAAKPDRLALPNDVSFEDLTLALKTICGRRLPLETRVPACQPTAFV